MRTEKKRYSQKAINNVVDHLHLLNSDNIQGMKDFLFLIHGDDICNNDPSIIELMSRLNEQMNDLSE